MSDVDRTGQPASGGLEPLLRGWDVRKLTVWDWVAGVAAVLVFIGSFLPWATVAGIINVSGTSGDGVITLILAIVSVALLAAIARTDVGAQPSKWLRGGVLLAGFVVMIIALVDIVDVGSSEFASPGGGLILVLLAGIAQTAAAGVIAYRNWSPGGVEPSSDQADGAVANKDASPQVAEPVPAEAVGMGASGAQGADVAGPVPAEAQDEERLEPAKTGLAPSTDDAAQGSPAGEVPTENGMSPAFQPTIDGRLLVKAGGAIMVLSTLFSWLKVGSDGFPNVAGVGTTTTGTGLAIFVLGLSLLLREWPIGVAVGKALGSFTITLVFLSMVGMSSGQLGAGAWLGLAGAVVALLGALHPALDLSQPPNIGLVRPLHAGVGGVLAVVASFWLDWVYFPGLAFNLGAGSADDGLGGVEVLSGFSPDVPFGIPVLILAAIALVLIADSYWAPSNSDRRLLLLLAQVAGIAITVIAGANVLGMMMIGFFVFGSGPLVALGGGILVTTSVRQT